LSKLLSVRSDAVLERPKSTEAGDAVTLDAARGERPPLPRKPDSDKATEPRTLLEGSSFAVPAPPRQGCYRFRV
jgi:hypothetical protein